MLIIADQRMPAQAKNKLELYGNVMYIETEDITYPAISGHPDIFFCRTEKELICAPNVPKAVLDLIECKEFGHQPVGRNYPDTARYNAVVTDKYFIHNLNYTDPVLIEKCSHLEQIHVNQAYTRCNLVALGDQRFITSDKGIYKSLSVLDFDVLFVKPDGILLPGFDHGFIGGCCGMLDNKIIFIGSLNYIPEGEKLRDYLFRYETIELYNGPLFDGGSIIFH